MPSAISSWQERPERLGQSAPEARPSDQRPLSHAAAAAAVSTAHLVRADNSTAQWIQEQQGLRSAPADANQSRSLEVTATASPSSPPITQELDQFGIPVHHSTAAATATAAAAAAAVTAAASPTPLRPSASHLHIPTTTNPGSSFLQSLGDLSPHSSHSVAAHAPTTLTPALNNANTDERDEDESIGLLLGPSKRRRARKDSYSSLGSSVLPPALATSRYNANPAVGYAARATQPKLGKTTYPASNHSGHAPVKSRQLPAPSHTQAAGPSPSRHSGAADLHSWLRTSQPPDSSHRSQQSVFPTSPSLQILAPADRRERSGQSAAFSEAGSRRGRYHQAGSTSGLSAGVLSAGPESPRSRRKASKSTSTRQGSSIYSQLDPDHPALMASRELTQEAESRRVDTIEEWRAKNASDPSTDAAASITPARDASPSKPRQRRRSSIKASDRPRSRDIDTPPVPPLPANRAAGIPVANGAGSVASTARRRRHKSPSAAPSLSESIFATMSATPAETAVESPAALHDLFSHSGVGTQDNTPVRRFIRWMVKEHLKSAILPVMLLVSLLLRWAVGRGSYSGRGVAPMFGDFEAQRHWIELTLHLPTSQWYFYDLPYWGLDYPPLTAWISLACGRIANLFPAVRPGFVFETSRGNENVATVTFMRASALVCEAAFYVPAVALFVTRKLEGRGKRTQAISFFSILLQPALLLIDHGHFQYNAVMLGFATACFALLYTTLPNPHRDALAPSPRDAPEGKEGLPRAKSHLADGRSSDLAVDLSRRLSYEYVAAAVFFCLSLSFKQMALYYAPAVFAIMLGRCVGLARLDFERGLTLFIGLGLAVVTTFGIVFAPWLTSFTQITQVVHRIFPLARGLFEDKVSNVWCFLSVLPLPQRYKLRNLLEVSSLARLSLVTTLLAILPGCMLLFWAASETAKLETLVAQHSIQQHPRTHERDKSAGASSQKSVTTTADEGRRKDRRRTPSVAGSIAGGAGPRSEIESLIAGSVSKTLRESSVQPSSDAARPEVERLQTRPVASTLPSPAAQMLPYGLLSVSMAFFLFGFQTHEKSILLPLLPITLSLGAKGDAWGGSTSGARDWKWIVWFNNVATFSLFPLLKKDGQALQYALLLLGWNWAVGHLSIPWKPTQSLTRLLSPQTSSITRLATAVYAAAAALHLAELVLPHFAPGLQARIWSRYPDVYPVLNVLFTTPCFGVIYIWALVRQIQVAFANGFELSAQDRTKSKKLAA